jgi:hypothetical protein
MNDLPNEIFRRWGHSYEEDERKIKVYRPSDYNFPPARGRAGIEFRQGGIFIDWVIGPADGSQSIVGKWQVETPSRVRIIFEGNARPSRTLEIVQVDKSILKILELLPTP